METGWFIKRLIFVGVLQHFILNGACMLEEACQVLCGDYMDGGGDEMFEIHGRGLGDWLFRENPQSTYGMGWHPRVVAEEKERLRQKAERKAATDREAQIQTQLEALRRHQQEQGKKGVNSGGWGNSGWGGGWGWNK